MRPEFTSFFFLRSTAQSPDNSKRQQRACLPPADYKTTALLPSRSSSSAVLWLVAFVGACDRSPPFPRPPPPPPPPAYIAWSAWPALDTFFLFPESRWCRSRTALMMSSRPILSRDARFRASTSYSAGRASMETVYSMWSSCVRPGVRISAAR